MSTNPFVEDEAPVEPPAPKRSRATTPPRVHFRGGLFLTYPQFAPAASPPVLETVKATLLGQLNPYVVRGRIPGGFDKGVVAREKHEDGSYHLHVWLRASGVTKQTHIDHSDLDLMGHHGNYQAAKSDNAVLKYCSKDGDYIWWGQDPKLSAEVKSKHLSNVLTDVIHGRLTVSQAVMEKSTLLLHYSRLVSNLSAFQASQVPQVTGQPLLLYLYGGSGVGKTSLATLLSEGRRSYFVSLPLASSLQQTWWFDQYHGEEIMIFDNLSLMTAPPYDLICRLVDRASCMLPVKGGFVPSRVQMVVMTSVKSPEALFTGHFDDQMRRRLTRVLHGEWMTPAERNLPRTENPLAPRILLDPVTSPDLTTTPLPPSSTTTTNPQSRSNDGNQVWWWDETLLFAPSNAVLGQIPPSTVALGNQLLPVLKDMLSHLIGSVVPTAPSTDLQASLPTPTQVGPQLSGDERLNHGQVLTQPVVDLFDLDFNQEDSDLPIGDTDGVWRSPDEFEFDRYSFQE